MEADGKRNNGKSIEDTFVQDELEYVAGVLQEDSKNYHAWSYRQWVARTVNDSALWEKELEYGKRAVGRENLHFVSIVNFMIAKC